MIRSFFKLLAVLVAAFVGSAVGSMPEAQEAIRRPILALTRPEPPPPAPPIPTPVPTPLPPPAPSTNPGGGSPLAAMAELNETVADDEMPPLPRPRPRPPASRDELSRKPRTPPPLPGSRDADEADEMDNEVDFDSPLRPDLPLLTHAEIVGRSVLPPGYFDVDKLLRRDGTDPDPIEVGQTILIEVLEPLPGRPITGDRTVRYDGTVSLGFYGDLKVAGLTRDQVKVKLLERLCAFLKDDTLGIVGFDPISGQNRFVAPAESDRVFVDDGLDDPAQARAKAARRAEREAARKPTPPPKAEGDKAEPPPAEDPKPAPAPG